MHAVKNSSGEVVYDIASILEVWHEHFSRLCTSTVMKEYDQEHFERITAQVDKWAKSADGSPFLAEPFTFDEVDSATKKYTLRKPKDNDGVMAEHIRHGGVELCKVLCKLYYKCVKMEYISPVISGKGCRPPCTKGRILGL